MSGRLSRTRGGAHRLAGVGVWARRVGVPVAVAGLVSGLGGYPAQGLSRGLSVPARHKPTAPAVPAVKPARGVGVLGVRGIPVVNQAASRYRPVDVSWPAPRWAAISLAGLDSPVTPSGPGVAARPPAAPRVFGAGIPVWAQPVAHGGGAVSAVRVHVLGHQAALAAGVRGVLFTATAAGGGGRVRLGLRYARFSQVSGGNYGLGLGLVELPGCALTTPGLAACRVQKPLDSVNDPASQTVSAPVTLPAAVSAGTAADATVSGGTVSGSTVVLAATTTPSDGGGSAGTYSATTLRASGSWSAGGSTGSFNYSYPMPAPAAPSSLVPSAALDYASATVDGQTAATQQQASWVGDGWSSPESYIEQSFVPCADNPEGSAAPKSTQDSCYNGPVITWSQAGASNPLVCPVPFSYTANSTCEASDDSGEVITHHVSSGNGSGTKFTDYWTVTGRDGTTYYFGLNHLPGWASGDAATNSADSEPVFSAHSGDPCYSSSGFGSSVCTMAYRWRLDYVKDVHGNAMAFYYAQDKNAYAENGNTASAVSYIRDSHLSRIDYGFTDPSAYSGHAPDQVVITTGDRCFAGTSSCDPLSSTTASNWPDVPYTQDHCAAGGSCQVTGPTFWSTVRLASVAAQQWNGSAYAPVDSWSLSHHFPATGDGTSPALWLDSVTRTGSDTTAGGSAVTLPKVSFAGTDLENRSNPGNYPALDRYRVSAVTTETGAKISVAYELTNSCMSPSSPPPDPSANTKSCFPVYWQQFSPPSPDWFNKWAVQQVSVSDPTGGSPGEFTSYSYAGAAWHYDDNELVMPKYRTYGQWRGYQAVSTFTGTGADAQTKSRTTYYQGMDGDVLPGGGTRSVTLTDSQGGQHTDTSQLAGDVLESTTYNFASGPADHSEISSYWVSAAAATRTRSGLPALTANATGQVEDWARQAITDGGTTSWRKTETDTSYDATTSDTLFGLPLFVFRHGDLSDPTQQACTATTYAPANTAKNLVGLAAETESDAQPCGGPNPGGASAPAAGQINALTAPTSLSRPADVMSDSRTFYDNPALAQTWPQPASPTWPQATPTKGDVSVVRQATGYVSGAFTYQTKNTAVFDSYGRTTEAYDGRGDKTATAYTMTNGVTTQEVVTNALGQATTTTFDPLRGLPASVTDPNAVTSTLHYDGLGRLTGVWQYNRATTAPANYVFSYAVNNNAPTVVTTQRLNDASGYITSTALYDALLRPRQTQQPTPQGGMTVTDTFYDSRGWVWKTNHDWWDSAATPGSAIVTIPDSQVPNQDVVAFDGLGRPVQDISYDDSTVKSTTYTAYYGDRVTTVPPTGGTPTSTVTDALGRTTELDSYTSAPAVTTSTANNITTVTISGGTTQATGYLFNHRGWLAAINDAATGQQWGKTYNLLGQVTGTTDPDAAASAMSYDPAGNLAASTDGDQHTISYSYDPLNRKTGEYDGPSSGSPALASWVYDNANNAISGMSDPIGQLTTETSYNGGNAYTIQQRGFNVFGEPLGQTLTLPSAEGALAGSYTISHTYTATTGLLYRDYYPASPGGGLLPAETVTHIYGGALDLPVGLGSNLAGYVQNTTYTAFTQVAQQQIGSTTTANDAYLTNSYDPHTGALTDSQTENPAVTTTPYDDTSYRYDPAGNVTAQTDVRNGAATETQCFTHDTLGRLTQAWTATDNCAADPSSNNGTTVGDGISAGAYWTSWGFDPLGDRTTQTQHSLSGGTSTVTTYSYNTNGANQPDTLTATSTTGPSGTATASYTYDTAGNTLTRNLPGGGQTLTWTHDGKLASDTTTAGTTSYVYDADGNLLLQKDPSQTTLFVFGEQIVLTTAGTSAGTITGTRFLPMPGGGLVARTGASSYSFELTDQHATSLLTLDSTARNPIWRQFTPYGAARGTAPPSWPDTNAFLGKPTDTNTSLDILGARQYDPTTGRFLSIDPVLNPNSPQELNGYTYAADDPATQADPSGLCPVFPDCNGIPQPGQNKPSNPSPGSGGGPGPGPGQGCNPYVQICDGTGGTGSSGSRPPQCRPEICGTAPPDLHPTAANFHQNPNGTSNICTSGVASRYIQNPGCRPAPMHLTGGFSWSGWTKFISWASPLATAVALATIWIPGVDVVTSGIATVTDIASAATNGVNAYRAIRSGNRLGGVGDAGSAALSLAGLGMLARTGKLVDAAEGAIRARDLANVRNAVDAAVSSQKASLAVSAVGMSYSLGGDLLNSSPYANPIWMKIRFGL